jgi:UDP-N-acetylglucosamine 2-epimerase
VSSTAASGLSGPIALFFGTRPQVIKASVLRDCLAAVGPVLAVDTGQHYDYALHRVHYEQLSVREPDACLDVGSGSHAAQTGALLVACEAWLSRHQPRLAVVIGDTNSTLASALAAVKVGVPVEHVEAGMRADGHTWRKRSIVESWTPSQAVVRPCSGPCSEPPVLGRTSKRWATWRTTCCAARSPRRCRRRRGLRSRVGA